MKISIIIVDYNTERFTINLIKSLFQYTDINHFDHEIIVVFNNSHNTKKSQLNSIASDKNITFIKQETNKGFGAANNIGVKHSSGDILFFLNPDTYFLKKIFFFKTLTCDLYDNECNGIVAPMILNPDGSIQSIGNSEPNLLSLLLEKLFFIRSNFLNKARYRNYRPKGIFKTSWVSGCAFTIRKDDYLKIGGFDERIFLYSEDVDLNLKLRQGLEKINLIDDRVSIVHTRGGSMNSKYKSFKQMKSQAENTRYVFAKHNIFTPYPIVFLIYFGNMLLNNIKERLKRTLR